jgi:hypothetical protein
MAKPLTSSLVDFEIRAWARAFQCLLGVLCALVVHLLSHWG